MAALVLAASLLSGCAGSSTTYKLVGWKRHFAKGVDEGHSVTTDPAGDIVLSGSVGDPADFGPAGTIGRSGDSRAFVAALDSHGNPQWTFATKAMAPGSMTSADAVSVDSRSNVYVVGNAIYGAIIGPDKTPYEGSGFIAKLTSAGQLVWDQPVFDNTHQDDPVTAAVSVVTDRSGDLFAAFECGSTAQVGNVVIQRPSYAPIGVLWPWLCVFALDGQGQAHWGRLLTADWTESTARPALAADSKGTLYVAARANEHMDFGGGQVPTPGANAVYVAALGDKGQVLWHREFGGSVADFGSLGIDAQGRLVLLMLAGGDVSIGGQSVGGNPYTRHSVLVWLSTGGKLLAHSTLPSSWILDTLAVGREGLVMLGTQGENEYGPTLVVQCDEDGGSCRSASIGEAWILYRSVAWHPDGDFVAAGSFVDGPESSYEEIAVGKFHIE